MGHQDRADEVRDQVDDVLFSIEKITL